MGDVVSFRERWSLGRWLSWWREHFAPRPRVVATTLEAKRYEMRPDEAELLVALKRGRDLPLPAKRRAFILKKWARRGWYRADHGQLTLAGLAVQVGENGGRR